MKELGILSMNAELDLLDMIDQHLEKRLELEKDKNNLLDLIPRENVMKELKVSSTTLTNWEKAGLKQWHPPFESNKKIYYRKSDIYNFLAVD